MSWTFLCPLDRGPVAALLYFALPRVIIAILLTQFRQDVNKNYQGLSRVRHLRFASNRGTDAPNLQDL
jgi:hypothetical protein